MNYLRLLWFILLGLTGLYVGLDLYLFVLLILVLQDWESYQ